MARWLIKEEPEHYAYSDLERDGRTEWDGVHNALALRHIRAMAVGDEALFYHTGDVRAAVGVAKVTRGPRADTSDPRPSWSVEIVPIRELDRSISLAELRQDPALAGFDLFRIGRLSVVPVTEEQWTAILAHESAGELDVREVPARPGRPVARSPRRARARRTAKPRTVSGAASRAPARRKGRGTGG